MARRKAPHIPDALLDQLLAGADPKTAFESDGLLDGRKKALAERALNAEMDHHLAGEEAGNTRNGYGRKTVTTETGRIELAIPRDRQATFDPQLIARHDFHPRLSPRRLLPGVSQTEGATDGCVTAGTEAALRAAQQVHQPALTEREAEQVGERRLQPLVG